MIDYKNKRVNLFIILLICIFIRLIWINVGANFVPNSLGGANWVKSGYDVRDKEESFDIKGKVSPDFNQVYHPIAQNLLDGKGFSLNGNPTAYVGPGYPFLLFLIYNIEQEIWLIRLIHIMLEVISCFAIFKIGQIIYNKKIGLISALLYALHPLIIYQSALLLTETLFTCLLITSNLIFICGIKRKRLLSMYFFAGVLLALSSLTRPNTLLFPFALITWGFFGTKIANRKIFFKNITVYTFGFLLIVTPWIIRNHIKFDKFIPVSGIIYHFYEDPNGLINEAEIKTGILSFIKVKIDSLLNDPLGAVNKRLDGALKILYKTNSGLVDPIAMCFQFILLTGYIYWNLKRCKRLSEEEIGLNIFIVYYYISLVLITKSTLVRYFIPIIPLILIYFSALIEEKIYKTSQ